MPPALAVVGIGRGSWPTLPVPIPLILLWPSIAVALGVVMLLRGGTGRPHQSIPRIEAVRAALLAFCRLSGLRAEIETADRTRVRIIII